MAFTDLWEKKGPTLSFEFYPARSEKAAAKLDDTITALMADDPDFVSVTFGAGGSSREGSRQLVRKLKGCKRSPVVGYVAAYGLAPEDLTACIEAYAREGVDAILCVRGDKPEEEGFTPHPRSFSHAWQFVELAKASCPVPLGVAGYPEGHVEAPSREKDWEYLKHKVDRGASFVISQYFYDNAHFFTFADHCRRIGIRVPILAGVMPIYSAKLTRSLAERCGASLPAAVEEGLAAIDPEDKEALESFGVDLAVRQCRELVARGVEGLHFYTMDRASSVRRILGTLRADGLLGRG